jgi:hypothetical protein
MNKPAIGSAIVIAAVAAAAVAPDASPPAPAQPAQVAPLPVSKDVARSLAVPERQTFAKERGLLFASPSWAQPPAAPATSKQQAQLSASAGVSAAPVPYRFVGTVKRATDVGYALAKGDVLFWVQEGETLDDYRVEAATPGTVTLLHLPSGERTTLVLAAPPPNSAVAIGSSTQLQSASPLAPESGSPQLNAAPAVDVRPALRAAQLRGPRNITQ